MVKPGSKIHQSYSLAVTITTLLTTRAARLKRNILEKRGGEFSVSHKLLV